MSEKEEIKELKSIVELFEFSDFKHYYPNVLS